MDFPKDLRNIINDYLMPSKEDTKHKYIDVLDTLNYLINLYDCDINETLWEYYGDTVIDIDFISFLKCQTSIFKIKIPKHPIYKKWLSDMKKNCKKPEKERSRPHWNFNEFTPIIKMY